MFRSLIAATGLACLTLPAAAQSLERVRVTFENLTPAQGNFFTPVWVGFHDGSFDLYDSGVPVFGPTAPLANDALERLAEDGSTGPVSAEFLAAGQLVDGTMPGPNGPIAPGERSSMSFLVDPVAPTSRYFSYASMVLPSNDAFIANGNPLEAPVYDAAGNFVFDRVFETGLEYLDAGSEVNDELPMNTAFFGQMMPNTGIDENGVVGPHPGFLPEGSGGILDDERFSESLFRESGYPGLKLRIERAQAITGFRSHVAILSGANEVPAVSTNASGAALFFLTDAGTRVRFFFVSDQLTNVVGMHLHAGAAGENGPIIVDLINPEALDSNPFPLPAGGGAFSTFSGSFDASALAGPFSAKPLERLMGQIAAGDVYINVHTNDGDPATMGGMGDFLGGELRGQVFRF